MAVEEQENNDVVDYKGQQCFLVKLWEDRDELLDFLLLVVDKDWSLVVNYVSTEVDDGGKVLQQLNMLVAMVDDEWHSNHVEFQ
jgi:hypothetical protein